MSPRPLAPCFRALAYGVLAALAAACGSAPAPKPTAPEPGPRPATPDAPRGSAALRVSVEGLRSERGELFVALFYDANGFPDEPQRATRGIHLPIAGETMDVRFDELPAGALAVAAFHDENSSGDLDKNWFGLPTEPWGVSNNASAFLGPPRFQDARLQLLEGQLLEIRITLHP